MTTDDVNVRIEGGVLEVTIDRPKANAIDRATSIRLGEIFSEFRDNPDFRVAIITGGGEKFFCAGWDLKAAAGGEEVDGDYGVGGFGGIQELEDFNKPIICAVNGICCGGGFEIALCADIIIAADHATFRTAGNSLGNGGRCSIHKVAEAHSLPYCDGDAADRPMARRRRGQSLGLRQ